MQLTLKFTPVPGTGLAALRLTFKDAANNVTQTEVMPSALQGVQPAAEGTYSYTLSGIGGLAAGPCEVTAQALNQNAQPLSAPKTFTVNVPLSEGGWIPNVLSIS
jgi:hypothetical protein